MNTFPQFVREQEKISQRVKIIINKQTTVV